MVDDIDSGSALSVAALAWRERWTGRLQIQVGQRLVDMPFRQGSPSNASQFSLLNAYWRKPAQFTFEERSGPRSFRASLGQLLIRLGKRTASPLEGGQVRLLIQREDVDGLALPEAFEQLLAKPGGRACTQDLSEALEDPKLLGAMAALGMLEHSTAPVVQPSEPCVKQLLDGESSLDLFLGDLSLEDLVTPDRDPTDQLLGDVRALTEQGKWREANRLMRDFVGSVERSALAAWRAWVALNDDSVAERERVVEALRWARLAERLPPEDEAGWLCQQVFAASEGAGQTLRCA